jgi:hypothetical protein
MQSSFGRPYPSDGSQPRTIAPRTLPMARTSPGVLVLMLTYAVASFAVLAFGVSHGA